jgi:ABC-type multidrug transport system fused ATPase/permease subunit
MPSASPSRGRALAALLRPDARRWGVLGALLAASSGLALAGPLVVRTIVDRAVDGAGTATFVALALAFLGIAIVTQAVGVVVIRYATVTAWGTTNELRLRMTRHVLGLDHEFHRTHTPGELISRVDGDVTAVSDFLSQVVPKAVGGFLLVGGMLTVLMVIDWRLGVGMLVYLGLAVVVLLTMRHPRDPRGRGRDGRPRAALRRHRGAAHRVRGPAGQWGRSPRHVALRRGQRRDAAQLGAAAAGVHRMWWAVQGSVTVGSVLALVVSATLVANDTITLGTGFLLFQYVLVIGRPLEDLVHELETVQKANGAMVRVLDLLEVRATIVDRGTTSPPAGALGVSCRGVSFGYADVDEGGRRAADPPRPRARHRAGPLGRRGRAHRLRQDDISRDCCCASSSRRRASSPWAGCRWRTSRSPSCAGGSPSCPRRSSCSRARSATT